MADKREHRGVGDQAREKLILAGLDLFGQRGLDGVSIRQISDKAGMNVASISYHFGSKEGLYIAIADYLNRRRDKRSKAQLEAGEKFVAAQSKDKTKALELILNITGNMVDTIIPESTETERSARFISRFQLSGDLPNHDLIKNPLHDLIAVLIGVVLGQPDQEKRNAILAETIFGQILVFRVHRLSSKLTLGISKFSADEVAQIKQVVFENIRKLLT